MPHGKTERFERAGYRIHFDRLRDVHADISVMRTHKFKCTIPDGEAQRELVRKFQQVASTVDSSAEGSLLWFLIQLYGLGFLFVSKEAKKEELLKRLCPDMQVSTADEVLAQLTPEVQDQIVNSDAFLTLITTTPRDIIPKIRATGFLPTGVLNNLSTAFTGELVKQRDLANYPILKRWHDQMVAFALEKGDLKEAQIQEFFGVRFQMPDTEGITFVIRPLPEAELRRNIDQGVDIYQAYFSYLLPMADRLGKKVQSLMGVDENQNGISNLLGITLKKLQASEENCRRLVRFGNPRFFENNPGYLNELAGAVYRLANTVKPAETEDFFKGNWGDYRNLIGGRLEGWVSNFQKRLDVYEEHLKPDGGHQVIFDEIADKCDWQNIFPVEQQQNFLQLQSLRPRVYDALQKKSGDLGVLLFEYNAYLKNFRELLAKWNNEGLPRSIFVEGEPEEIHLWDERGEVPAFSIGKSLVSVEAQTEVETRGTKSIGYWSKARIPKELEQYPRFIGQAQRDPKQELDLARQTVHRLTAEGVRFVQVIREGNALDTAAWAEFDQHQWGQNWRRDKSGMWLKDNRSGDFGLFHKSLDGLARIAGRFPATDQGPQALRKLLQPYVLEEKITDVKQRLAWQEGDFSKMRFYVSGYERKNQEFIPVGSVGFLEFFAAFETSFEIRSLLAGADASDWLRLQGVAGRQSIFRGEILKLYWALCLRPLGAALSLPVSATEFRELASTTLAGLLFDEQGAWKEQAKKKVVIQRFVQASLGAEIRGKLSLLSRGDYVERHVIQTTNGEQSLLQYISLEWGDFSDLAVKKIKGKRTKLTARKLDKLKQSARRAFSDNAIMVLDSFGIAHSGRSNQDIVSEIWDILPKQAEEAKRKLAQVLGEIPHRWAVVLKTKQPFSTMQPIENGFLIEKSTDKSNFNLTRSKRTDQLYSFRIETSAVQKQFLENFLWGDKHEKLTTTISGSSVILETTKKAQWNGDQVEFIDDHFAMYCAIPFGIGREKSDDEADWPREETIIRDGKEQPRKVYREQQNILGIDLGEYGFGWAVFDPRAGKFVVRDGKVAVGFQDIPLLKTMRDSAASWRDTQARGIFSRPTTHLAELREQAAGQARNQIHRLAMKYNARPIYEDSVDGFESGGNRVSKLYKTLKTADVISGNSNDADKQVRKHFWGVDFAQIGGVIGSSKTSQTCRACGRCATSEIEEEISSATGEEKIRLQTKRDEIKKAQRRFNPAKPNRGSDALFVCQICGNQTDADEQAARNIALKYFFANDLQFQAEREELKRSLTDQGRRSITLPFFLRKSQESKWLDNVL